MIKKTVRRRRKKKKPYFDKNAHDAIVKYQAETETPKRNEIYIHEILPSFNKLAENLIFIHGFAKQSGVTYEVLKSDCVSFLFETLDKFDATRGSKAFSYFNVVAKNWLIIQSKKRTKHNRRMISLDSTDVDGKFDSSNMHANFKVPASQDFKMMISESKENLSMLMIEIRGRLQNENELACIDAIITLFNKIDSLDLLNKRAVFVYMRDISGLNPKQLSVAMSTIRKHYRDLVKDDKFDIFFWKQ
jgi:hypothetical protein